MSQAVFVLVSGILTSRGESVCKTVGSAYVGSNPTPATTCHHLRKRPAGCEFSRSAGRFSLSRRVSSCVAVDRCVAVSTDAWRTGFAPWDGRCAPSAVSRTATDGTRLAARFPGSNAEGGGFRLAARLRHRQLPRFAVIGMPRPGLLPARGGGRRTRPQPGRLLPGPPPGAPILSQRLMHGTGRAD
jgi:hypothetical protein